MKLTIENPNAPVVKMFADAHNRMMHNNSPSDAPVKMSGIEAAEKAERFSLMGPKTRRQTYIDAEFRQFVQDCDTRSMLPVDSTRAKRLMSKWIHNAPISGVDL